MKILLDNGGQTCNKFWSYIPLLQEGLKEGKRYIVPFFDRELGNYPALLNSKIFVFPFYSKYLLRLFGYERIMYMLTLPINNRFYDITPRLLKSNFVVDAWGKRSVPIEQDILMDLKSYFLPSDTIQHTVKEVFNELKKQNRPIIGVHIRRGDYKYWRNGLYYFEFVDYAEICNNLCLQYNEVKPVFFLASNERIPMDIFSDIDICTVKTGGMPADLYALSCCDYIIGPPSSFSRFASFMGNVPICFITEKKFTQFNFKIVKTYNKYHNDEPIEFDF